MTDRVLRVFLYSVIPFLALGCGEINNAVSCNCEGNILETLSEIEGTMLYDSQTGRWYIQSHKTNKQGEVCNYLIGDVTNTYKIVGMQVRFSGDVYLPINEPPIEAGIKEYCIDLLSVEGMPDYLSVGCYKVSVVYSGDKDYIDLEIEEWPEDAPLCFRQSAWLRCPASSLERVSKDGKRYLPKGLDYLWIKILCWEPHWEVIMSVDGYPSIPENPAGIMERYGLIYECEVECCD